MSFDFNTLAPLIFDILSGPGVDLASIGAKSVKRHLLARNTSLSSEFLKANKAEVNAVIQAVFEQVSACAAEGAEGSSAVAVEKEVDQTSRKRKQEGSDDERNEGAAAQDHEEKALTGSKKTRKMVKKELSDAELARKLSSEINGRSTRASGSGRGTKATPKKGPRVKKSAALIHSDDDSDEGGNGKTKSSPKKKSTGGGGAKGGFAKEYDLRYGYFTTIWIQLSANFVQTQ